MYVLNGISNSHLSWEGESTQTCDQKREMKALAYYPPQLSPSRSHCYQGSSVGFLYKICLLFHSSHVITLYIASDSSQMLLNVPICDFIVTFIFVFEFKFFLKISSSSRAWEASPYVHSLLHPFAHRIPDF